jgi:hypothetical protein
MSTNEQVAPSGVLDELCGLMVDVAEVAPRAPAAAIAWVAVSELLARHPVEAVSEVLAQLGDLTGTWLAGNTLRFVAAASNGTIDEEKLVADFSVFIDNTTAEQFRTERGEDDRDEP